MCGVLILPIRLKFNIDDFADNAPYGTLQTRDNFKGCIRNLAINGERRDWTDMASLHNVLLNACPLSSYWMQRHVTYESHTAGSNQALKNQNVKILPKWPHQY